MSSVVLEAAIRVKSMYIL